jgi:hypothetical protein
MGLLEPGLLGSGLLIRRSPHASETTGRGAGSLRGCGGWLLGRSEAPIARRLSRAIAITRGCRTQVQNSSRLFTSTTEAARDPSKGPDITVAARLHGTSVRLPRDFETAVLPYCRPATTGQDSATLEISQTRAVCATGSGEMRKPGRRYYGYAPRCLTAGLGTTGIPRFAQLSGAASRQQEHAAGLLEQLGPAIPAAGRQPEPVDEDDRRLLTGVSPLDLLRLAGRDRSSLRVTAAMCAPRSRGARHTLSGEGRPSNRCRVATTSRGRSLLPLRCPSVAGGITGWPASRKSVRFTVLVRSGS